MEENYTFIHQILIYLLICLQTVLASQGRATWDIDNNTTRPVVTQFCSTRSFLFAAVHRTSHMPLDCLTTQNGNGQ